MAEIVSSVVPELFDGFRELAELNEFIGDQHFSGAANFQRDELVASLGSKMVGHRVEVTELPIARESGERPIERWTIANTLQIESLARAVRMYDPRRRLHPGTGRQYLPNDTWRYRRHSRGKVEAIDGQAGSVVVRPRGLMALYDRDWVKIVSSEGESLVDMVVGNQ